MTTRQKRYALYFTLAVLASLGISIFIIASILSAGSIPAFLVAIAGTSGILASLISAISGMSIILQAVILGIVYLIAALILNLGIAVITAFIDRYFAAITYILLCFLYYSIYPILLIPLLILDLLCLGTVKLFDIIAEKASQNIYVLHAVYFTLAILASLAIGAIVAVSILSAGAIPAILTFLSSVAVIGGAISSIMAGMSLVGQALVFGAVVSLIMLIPSLIIAKVAAPAVFNKEGSFYENWFEPATAPLFGKYDGSSSFGKIDDFFNGYLFKHVINGMTAACEYFKKKAGFSSSEDKNANSPIAPAPISVPVGQPAQPASGVNAENNGEVFSTTAQPGSSQVPTPASLLD